VVAIPLAVAAGKTDPQGAAGHVTTQVTPLFAGSLVTVAVNFAVAPASTVAVLGVTETTGPGITTVAKPDAEVLATEAAVMVTVKSLVGGVVGAV
jgi:hypothetical protein